MKVLFVCSPDSVYDDKANPFVSSLIKGLNDQGGIEIECDSNSLWHLDSSYDLIYFQWPEQIFRRTIDDEDLANLTKQFDIIKKKHIKTVITCHNLLPHNGNPKIIQLYDLVYSKVNAFHHMGNHSYQLMKLKYPNAYHFIAPHHIDDCYLDLFKSNGAKSSLSIPANDIVIASFGAFRNQHEKNMFLSMVDDMKGQNVRFLAPRLIIYDRTYFNWIISYIKNYLTCRANKIKTAKFLEEYKLRQWLSATDIVFIQRKEILNSGNVPLAFAAGKVVVGPDKGNVGEILKETGNFVFDPDNRESIKMAVLNAIDSVKRGNPIGQANHFYAKKNWNVPLVSKVVLENLHHLLSRQVF